MNDFRCTFLQPNFDTEVKKNEVIIVFYEESFKLCSEIDPQYVPRRVLGRNKVFRHSKCSSQILTPTKFAFLGFVNINRKRMKFIN